MRTTVEFEPTGTIDWEALRSETDLLYREIADERRAVLGVGVLSRVEAPEFDANGFALDWYFGALEYEWRGPVDPAPGPAKDAAWFIPKWVVEWKGDRVFLHVDHHAVVEASIWVRKLMAKPDAREVAPIGSWELQTTREQYLQHVDELIRHIQRGDIYEVNFCIRRTVAAIGFDPFVVFGRSAAITRAPFAGFYRCGDHFALCSSPERFLSFHGRTVKAQPMKGTRPRNSNPKNDKLAALELSLDPKERSENVMALDVMRNDLSRIATSGSVVVDELCKVIPLQRVHQMISTVSATMRSGVTPNDVIRATFPMASMTGAPKVRAMGLIEKVEDGPRGLFSGSLGFFAPDGTGDLNVVIRTALYNAATERITLHTGSAITARCEPEREWDECTLKAISVIDALAPTE